MKIMLPKLNYGYNYLEPFIDATTMEIHHSKHHQTYIDKANGVLEKYPELQKIDPEQLLRDAVTLQVTDSDRQAIINNVGGHVNHAFFWTVMDPANKPDPAMSDRITGTFGSLSAFREKFSDTAVNRFGSGWAWLVEKPDRTLAVYATSNQDSPLTLGDKPLIALDVWEHAYYLKYQNRRAEYVKNWWNTVKLIG